jgi:ketosteroid isomerase-like protein
MRRRESQVVTVQSNRSSSVNAAKAPEDLHKLFAQALNSGDLDALVALYAFDAFLMTRSGPARGIMAIGRALAEYVAMKPTIQLTTRKVVQVEDTALLVADWRFHGTAADGRDVSTSGTSIEVARRQSDGSWRYLIDLPYGLG